MGVKIWSNQTGFQCVVLTSLIITKTVPTNIYAEDDTTTRKITPISSFTKINVAVIKFFLTGDNRILWVKAII